MAVGSPTLSSDKFLQDLLDLDTSSSVKRKKILPKPPGAVQATQRKFQVSGLQDYMKATQNFPLTRTIQVGYFYSFVYKFQTHYKMNTLKFFDYQPLAFMYSKFKPKNKAGVYYMGINFHRLPLKVRQMLINKIFVYEGVRVTKVTKRKKLDWDYSGFHGMLKKVGFAVRMYKVTRIYKPRRISLKYIKQLLTFYPETLYNSNMSTLWNEYRAFKKS